MSNEKFVPSNSAEPMNVRLPSIGGLTVGTAVAIENLGDNPITVSVDGKETVIERASRKQFQR